MKLEKIKFLYKKITINRSLNFLLFILLLFFFTNTQAQDFQFNFKRVTLAEALNQVALRLKINVAFDAQKLSSIAINKTIKANNEMAVLKLLLENTGQDVDFKHNSYLVFPSKQTNANVNKKKFHLIGAISDNETGETLPYANIQIVNSKLYASASASGTFSFKNVDNQVQLSIRYLGYEALDTLIALRDSMDNFKFKMNKKALVLNTFNVKAGKLSMLETGKEPGLTSLNPASFYNLPGLGETDVFKTIQLLPGIQGSENSSELNIRGSSSSLNLVLLDGLTLYKVDHFFGSFSMINPQIVKDIQIYKGGFDARFGERVSGIIDMTGKAGNCYKPKVYGSFNQIAGSLTLELPITKKLTLIAAGRRTYGNLYNNKIFKEFMKTHLGETKNLPKKNDVVQEPDFYFFDYNAKLSYNINENEKLSISTFGGKDNLTDFSDSKQAKFNVKSNDGSSWENIGTSACWTKQWNASYFTNLQIGYSAYHSKYESKTQIKGDSLEKMPDPFQQKKENEFEVYEMNNLTDYSISLKNSYLFDYKNQLDWGVMLRYNDFEFNKDAGQNLVYNKLKQTANLSTVFVQNKYNPWPQINIKTGMRVNVYRNNFDHLFLEPRLSISYQAIDSLFFKLACGRYCQFVNKISIDQQYGYKRDFWMLSNGKDHPVITSNHFIVGASYQYAGFLVDVEAYYKSTNNLQDYLSLSPFLQNDSAHQNHPPEQTGASPNANRFIEGRGEAWGLDCLLQYESEKYTSWISYSLSNSIQQFSNINNGNPFESPYDQTNNLSFVNMLAVGKWNFSLLYTYASGKPYIMKSEVDNNFKTTRTFNRLDGHQRVDVSLNYGFNIKKMDVKIGLSIINALNSEYYYDVYTREFDFENTRFGENTFIKALGFTPNLFINFKF